MTTTSFDPMIEALGFVLPPHDVPARLGPGAADDGAWRWVSGFVTVRLDSRKRSEISPADDSGMVLVSYTQTEDFAGGITGTGVATHVGIQRPDGTLSGTGVERIVGSLDGRQGSFVINDAGFYDTNNVAHGRMVVVAGSGTGELVGLRAQGDFTVAWTANGPVSIYNLAYRFESGS